jgi:hypothetical protein
MNLRQKILFKLINFWPPFLGAGIRIDRFSEDFYEVDVSLKLTFWNRNYVGVAYGGSLYSMTDPYYMLMLLELMGKDYIVWDKAASIRFIKPGTQKVFAKFRLSPNQIEQFKNDCEVQKKIEPVLIVNVVDGEGNLIAEVTKTLYIKKKRV